MRSILYRDLLGSRMCMSLIMGLYDAMRMLLLDRYDCLSVRSRTYLYYSVMTDLTVFISAVLMHLASNAEMRKEKGEMIILPDPDFNFFISCLDRLRFWLARLTKSGLALDSSLDELIIRSTAAPQ